MESRRSLNSLELAEAINEGHTLAIADRVLIDAKPGTLSQRVEELLAAALDSRSPATKICQVLIRLGMNFAGREAELVGYSDAETELAFEQTLHTIGDTKSPIRETLGSVVDEFLADMKSVNRGDSLPGQLAERIEAELDRNEPACSFLRLLRKHVRSGVYWRMIGNGYSKFGNDYARGLEYLRHYGFCQVSTNPVLAAKAFDEDPRLSEELKLEVERHSEWKTNPEAHADEIAMAATLIALWPNLSVFRPLALHTKLKDFMVSFQLNPNIADDEEFSVADARRAYQLAADYLTYYDKLLGLGEKAGKLGPNIVFKIAGSSQAARNITLRLNAEGIGTNNTVVYSLGQEVQLILDALRGKAEASRQGRTVTRTYETNMGGRFVSHLREVVAERVFERVAEKSGNAKADDLLESLAHSLSVDQPTRESLAGASVADKTRTICSFKYLKTLDHPEILKAAEAAGEDAKAVKQWEADLRKAGTLVARRVYSVFYSSKNRPKWIAYLQKTYGLTIEQARDVLESMDVLPASKRIPEDTFHALGSANMCHTEFPNQARAVQSMSEQEGFRLEDFRESVLDSYEATVVRRLTALLPDFSLGYELPRSLNDLLVNQVGLDEVSDWGRGGIEPQQWPTFGPVQKTSAEFQAAYTAFAAKCVALVKELKAASVGREVTDSLLVEPPAAKK